MDVKQLELPMDKTIDVRKDAKNGWKTIVKVLPNGHQQVITVKQPLKR